MARRAIGDPGVGAFTRSWGTGVVATLSLERYDHDTGTTVTDDLAPTGAAHADEAAHADDDDEVFFDANVPAGVETLTHGGGTGTIDVPAPGVVSVDDSLAERYDRRELTTGRFVAALAGRSVEALGDLTGGGYTLLKPIGEGAMGEVFVARDEALGRRVAYKRLKPRAARADDTRRRFLAEAQVTAQLEHPHIVPVYGLGNPGEGEPAFALKLIHGQTLADLIVACREDVDAGRPLCDARSLPARLDHFLKVCDAISYAHAKGVVHRDLKPSNIMIGAFGEVYVMDWGIAHIAGRPVTAGAAPADTTETMVQRPPDATATRDGQLVGTPAYMSPEQARGQVHLLDGRSDQFGLGVILRELVTLTPSYPEVTSLADMLALAGEARLCAWERDRAGARIPRELRGIIRRATQRATVDRYPTIGALADDVRRYLRGQAVEAAPDGPLQRLLRWTSRHRAHLLVLVLLTVLTAGGVVAWSLISQHAARTRAQARALRLTQLQTAVAGYAHRTDRQFLALEGAVRALAASAAQALSHGEARDAPLYPHEAFEDPDPARRPPGAVRSRLYDKVVSVRVPGYKLAPGVDLDQVRPQLARLMPVADELRRLFVDSAGRTAAAPAPDEVERLLMTEGVPLRWAYVGLESGVMLSFPGKSGYPPDYDPRRRPWYELSARQHGPRWGNPYIDLQGQGLILPCTTSLFGADGEFLGVAGVELTFDYVIGEMLTLAVDAVDEAYLLDGEGRIVVSSADARERLGGGQLHGALALPTFPHARVVEAARAGREGFVELEAAPERRPWLFTLHRLDTIGWSFVTRVDPARLSAP